MVIGTALLISTAFQLAMIAQTLWRIWLQWRAKKAVPAWMEWILVAQLGCLALAWLHGVMGIPALALILMGIIGVFKEQHAEKRRHAKRLAELQQEQRQLEEETMWLHACQVVMGHAEETGE